MCSSIPYLKKAARLKTKQQLLPTDTMTIKKTILAVLIFGVSTLNCQNTKLKLNSIDFTLPGKWKLLSQNENSGQYTLENVDTKTAVAISARHKTKFEFYSDSLADFQLIEKFYHWDADYWRKDPKFKVTEIKRDEKNKLVVWHLVAPQGANYILNGIRDSYIIVIQVQGDKTTEVDRIKLVEFIYLNCQQ